MHVKMYFKSAASTIALFILQFQAAAPVLAGDFPEDNQQPPVVPVVPNTRPLEGTSVDRQLNGGVSEQGRTPLEGGVSDQGKSAPLQGGVSGQGKSTQLEGGLSAQGAKTRELKSGVHKTGVIMIPAPHIKLTAEQVKEAVNQYKGDITSLYSEVGKYNAMMKDFNQIRGACNENETAYKAQVRQDQLNLKTIQLPASITTAIQPPPMQAVDPPRVCCEKCLATGQCGTHLGGSGGGAMSAGASKAMAEKTRQAQLGLARSQTELKNAESETQFTRQKAIDEAEIESKQQQLSAQFSKLQDLYKMLKIEHDTLANSVSVIHTKSH